MKTNKKWFILSVLGLAFFISCSSPAQNDNNPKLEFKIPTKKPKNDNKNPNNDQYSSYPDSALIMNSKRTVPLDEYESAPFDPSTFATGDPRIDYTKNYRTNDVPNHHYNFLNDITASGVISHEDRTQNVENGTFWIMDFIIPDDGSYPTTWFYATNLHVAEKLSMGKNDYDVTKSNNDFIKLDGKTWGAFSLDTSDDLKDRNQDNKSKIEYMGHVGLLNHPKVIFEATNFLGKDLKLTIRDYKKTESGKVELKKQDITLPNYTKDFAVVEIKFNDPEQAKKITKNFYERYKNKKLQFKKQSYLTSSVDDLIKEQDIFIAGYPVKNGAESNSELVFNLRKSNNNLNHGAGFYRPLKMISGDMVKGEDGNHLPGIINDTISTPNTPEGKDPNERIDTISVHYGGIRYQRAGFAYNISDSYFTGGASGSAVINNKNEIIGILYGGNAVTQSAHVDMIISEGLKYKDDNYPVHPKYDLIFGGVPNQTKSFLGQMKKYYKNKTSWLFGKIE